MAGHSQYYRENASITSSLMNSQEAGFRAGDGISFQPQPPMSPYESSNYPHFNQRTRAPVQTTPRWEASLPSLQGSQPPEQDQSVHSKLDKMMNMLSSTQDLVIQQQRSHKALEEKVESLSEKLEKHIESTTANQDSEFAKFSRPKIPSELSGAIRKLHESASKKFDSSELYSSKHNEETAELLLSQLKGMEFKEQLTDRLMKRGIHRYYESRRRTYNDSQPSRVNVAKENKRRGQKTAFRKRLYSRRAKFIRPSEKDKWTAIDWQYMTDESDSDDGVRQHKLEWRSVELNTMMRKLDRRAEKSSSKQNGRFTMKTRVLSSPSTLDPPQCAPSWTITTARVPEQANGAAGTLTPHGDTGVGNQVRRNLVPGFTAEQIARDELSESSDDSGEDSQSDNY